MGMHTPIYGMPKRQYLGASEKIRLMKEARRLLAGRRTEDPEKKLTAWSIQIYEALLFRFHSKLNGLCFPSRQTIANWVGSSVDTVDRAVRRLEAAGLITWLNRVVPLAEHHLRRHRADPFRHRVVRGSNAYVFTRAKEVTSDSAKGDPSKHGNQPVQRNEHRTYISTERDSDTFRSHSDLSHSLSVLASRILARNPSPARS